MLGRRWVLPGEITAPVFLDGNALINLPQVVIDLIRDRSSSLARESGFFLVNNRGGLLGVESNAGPRRSA